MWKRPRLSDCTLFLGNVLLTASRNPRGPELQQVPVTAGHGGRKVSCCPCYLPARSPLLLRVRSGGDKHPPPSHVFLAVEPVANLASQPRSPAPRGFCRLPAPWLGLSHNENGACRQGPAADPNPGPRIPYPPPCPQATGGPVGDSPCVQKPGAKDHDGFARALLELHLDGAELAVDDADHALDLLGGDGPGPALLPQQVHHVGGKLVARLEEQDNKQRAVWRLRAWTQTLI